MRSLARRGASSEVVRDIAVQSSGGGDLLLLDSWIRERFVYRPEYEEIVRTPEFMLSELERNGFFDGDCDDVSTLSAALLLARGYRVRFVAIRYGVATEFSHVYVESETPQGVQVFDATVAPGTVYHETERMVMDV